MQGLQKHNKIMTKFAIKSFFMALGAFVLFLQVPLALAIEAFSDVNSAHPNYTAIMDLKGRGMISGYPDGSFKPDQPVNRVEALKIILNAANIDAASATRKAPFSDIAQDQWYAPFLNKAYDLGIVEGYADGAFKPTQTVNLVENLKMLLATYKIDLSAVTVSSNIYADAFADQWYAKYVQYAKDKKLIVADAENMIYPGQGMTRGKLAELAYRLIYITENDLEYFGQVVSDEDLPTPPSGRDDTLQVNISATSFSVPDLLVPLGTTVRWTNLDTKQHNVTSASFKSPNLNNGDSYEYTFNSEGTFNYYCSLHPAMTGKITVKPAYMVPTIYEDVEHPEWYALE